MPLDISGDIAGLGKIVQIVRATDTTFRSTQSLSYVDTGLNVSITPISSNSSIIIVHTCFVQVSGSGTAPEGSTRIVNQNTAPISGAERANQYISTSGANIEAQHVVIGYDSPNSTSQQTYKTQFFVTGSGKTINILNQVQTGQLFAIEVAA